MKKHFSFLLINIHEQILTRKKIVTINVRNNRCLTVHKEHYCLIHHCVINTNWYAEKQIVQVVIQFRLINFLSNFIRNNAQFFCHAIVSVLVFLM